MRGVAQASEFVDERRRTIGIEQNGHRFVGGQENNGWRLRDAIAQRAPILILDDSGMGFATDAEIAWGD